MSFMNPENSVSVGTASPSAPRLPTMQGEDVVCRGALVGQGCKSTHSPHFNVTASVAADPFPIYM